MITQSLNQAAALNALTAFSCNAGPARRRVSEQHRSAKTSNAKGVPSSSPVLPRSGYAGITQSKLLSTPTGLRPLFGRGVDGTPLGVRGDWGLGTQGRRFCVAPTLGWRSERRWRSSRTWHADRPTLNHEVERMSTLSRLCRFVRACSSAHRSPCRSAIAGIFYHPSFTASRRCR